MHVDNWDWLIEAVRELPVRGEAASWNCQDYVLGIWEMLLEAGVIEHDVWSNGYDLMLPYFGQDFGGQGGHEEYEEQEGEEEEGNGGKRFKSQEFVYDSDA